MSTKEIIEKVVDLIEDNAGELPTRGQQWCSICHYEKNCDEHVRCADGIAQYLHDCQE